MTNCNKIFRKKSRGQGLFTTNSNCFTVCLTLSRKIGVSLHHFTEICQTEAPGLEKNILLQQQSKKKYIKVPTFADYKQEGTFPKLAIGYYCKSSLVTH